MAADLAERFAFGLELFIDGIRHLPEIGKGSSRSRRTAARA